MRITKFQFTILQQDIFDIILRCQWLAESHLNWFKGARVVTP